MHHEPKYVIEKETQGKKEKHKKISVKKKND